MCGYRSIPTDVLVIIRIFLSTNETAIITTATKTTVTSVVMRMVMVMMIAVQYEIFVIKRTQQMLHDSISRTYRYSLLYYIHSRLKSTSLLCDCAFLSVFVGCCSV